MRQYWGKDALKNRFVFNSPYPKDYARDEHRREKYADKQPAGGIPERPRRDEKKRAEDKQTGGELAYRLK